MIQPNEILAVAVKLVSAPRPSEAECRSAISRAYYSVFHHVIGRLGIDLDRGAGPMHQRVQNELLSQPIVCPPDVLAAKAVFATMKRERERADYTLTDTVTLHQAQTAISRAQKVLLAHPP